MLAATISSPLGHLPRVFIFLKRPISLYLLKDRPNQSLILQNGLPTFIPSSFNPSSLSPVYLLPLRLRLRSHFPNSIPSVSPFVWITTDRVIPRLVLFFSPSPNRPFSSSPPPEVAPRNTRTQTLILWSRSPSITNQSSKSAFSIHPSCENIL